MRLQGNTEAEAAILEVRDDIMRAVVEQRRESLGRRDSFPSDSNVLSGVADAALSRRKSKGSEIFRRVSNATRKEGLWDVVSRLARRTSVSADALPSGVGMGLGMGVGSEYYSGGQMDEATRAWVRSELEGRRANYDRQQPRINEIAEVAGEEDDEDEDNSADGPTATALVTEPEGSVVPPLANLGSLGEPLRVVEEEEDEGSNRKALVGDNETLKPPFEPLALGSLRSGHGALAAAAAAPILEDRPIGQLPAEAYLPFSRSESSSKSMMHQASLNRVLSFKSSARGMSVESSLGASGPSPAPAAPVAIASLTTLAITAPLGQIPRRTPSVHYQRSGGGAGGASTSPPLAAGSVSSYLEGSYSLPRQPMPGRTSITGTPRQDGAGGDASPSSDVLPPPQYPALPPQALKPGEMVEVPGRAQSSAERPAADRAPCAVVATPSLKGGGGLNSSVRADLSPKAFTSTSKRRLSVEASAAAPALAPHGSWVSLPPADRVGASKPPVNAILNVPRKQPSDTAMGDVPPPPVSARSSGSRASGHAGHGGAQATTASIYYVNPNAIGGAAAGAEGDGDVDSYVQSRISVVQRIRHFAANMFLQPVSDQQQPRKQPPSGQTTPKVSLPPVRGVPRAGQRRVSISGGVPPVDTMQHLRASSVIASRVGSAAATDASQQAAGYNPVTPAAQEKDRAVVERLRLVTRWDFDVFEFGANTESRPLAYISYELFVRFRLFDRLRVPEQVFTAFLNRIELDYCFEPEKPNPYHTSLHAADVVQAVGHFLTVPRLGHIMDQLDAFSVLVSAIIHDFRHPGVNNNFLVKTGHALALRYNDESVLENFHAAEAFAVLAHERYNIMQSLTPSQRSASRFTIIKTVLATDLAQV